MMDEAFSRSTFHSSDSLDLDLDPTSPHNTTTTTTTTTPTPTTTMPSPLLQRRLPKQRKSPVMLKTTTMLLFCWTLCHSWHTAHGQVNCYSNLNTISLREGLLSASDLSQVRSYSLCSGTYTIGTLNYDNELSNGQDMLPLRSNMRIQCGETGSRDNVCIINGGDVQVDGTNLYSVPDGTVDNVVLEGLTFIGSMKHMVWINKPGDVLFKDCEFRENGLGWAPVLLDYFDRDAGSTELRVTFEDCLFDQNQFAGEPGQDALVVGNSQQNRLVFEQCQFTNNDMIVNNREWRTTSFLVESSGPVSMIGSCFKDNAVGFAPIAVYNPEYFFVNNYGNNSTGVTCPFAGRYETAAQFDNLAPVCSAFDADVCSSDVVPVPTMAPTSSPTAPTSSPSSSPSILPSAAPSQSMAPSGSTESPSVGPSAGPSTAEPSSGPSETGSRMPSIEPSLGPSGTASLSPSAGPSVFQSGRSAANDTSSSATLVGISLSVVATIMAAIWF